MNYSFSPSLFLFIKKQTTNRWVANTQHAHKNGGDETTKPKIWNPRKRIYAEKHIDTTNSITHRVWWIGSTRLAWKKMCPPMRICLRVQKLYSTRDNKRNSDDKKILTQRQINSGAGVPVTHCRQIAGCCFGGEGGGSISSRLLYLYAHSIFSVLLLTSLSRQIAYASKIRDE